VAVFNKFESFVEAVAEGVHNFETATITLALFTNATPPAATDTNLAAVKISATEVPTANGYDQGARPTLAGKTSGQASGTYTLSGDNIAVTASGGSIADIRYFVLFNDSAAGDEVIGWYDYSEGSGNGTGGFTLLDGESVTLQFDVSGILTIA